MKSEDWRVRWKKVALIGVGLLGGSIGRALKKNGHAANVTGFVRRRASIRECLQARAVNSATLDLEEAVSGADLIVLCTPIAQMQGLAKQMVPHLKSGVIVTDVGSVKGSVVRELESIVARAGGHFVGSHPMAGAEKTGVQAARADLFEAAVCVITPTSSTSRGALKKVEGLWKSLGSRILRLSPAVHDRLVSRSSHLPHIVAAVLARGVLSPGEPPAQRRLCANGFRDCTRVASGSPEMWRDIALANRKNLSQALSGFIVELRRFNDQLKRADEKSISAVFREAKARRDHWRSTQVSPSPE